MSEDRHHKLKILCRDLRSLFNDGCTDGYCQIRPTRGGMHTNGGCRCIERLADLALEVAAEADRVKRFSMTNGPIFP